MINIFRGDYWFLSNMCASRIVLGGVTYTCAEAAFQAVKLSDKSQRATFQNLDGKAAKALGKKIVLRQDWEEIKLDAMRWIVHEKFRQNPYLAKKLLATGEEELVEFNTWYDTFWGVTEKEGGKNWLGKILMEERQRLKGA